MDTGTYINEPSGSLEQFAVWVKSFDIDSKKGDISELLISMVEVRSLYATLVSNMRGSRNFRQGCPGQPDKKALTVFVWFFLVHSLFKETKSATMNIFRNFLFSF